MSRCRLSLVCLVSLLASMGAQAQNSTVTICAGNAINLNSVVSAPAGSTLSFSIKPPATAIAAGAFHGLALLVDGTVVGWGFNDFGQLNVPTSATPAKAISAGFYYSLALKADGRVVGWGDIGQVVPASATPSIAIAAGSQYSLALKADGTVVGWGSNQYGQLNVPASVTTATAIAAGTDHSLALKGDGTVVAWGRNLYGQLTVPTSAIPATAIAAGSGHSLALKANGSVVGWGDNVYGQTNVSGSAAPAIAIAAGSQHSLALKANGTVVGWGYNNHGQTNVPASAMPATAIAAGRDYSLAVKANGSVVGWGDNSTGQTAGYDVQPLTSPVVSPTATQTYYYIAHPPSGSPTYGTITVALNTGAPPARLYVKANATGAGNGLSWADALPDLQQALTYRCAQNLTEIWVAAGTYKPTTTTDRTISFSLQNGVAIYGGFAGNETSLSQRPAINPVTGQPSSSILSGDIGAVGNAADNTYHVINNAPGLTSTAVLDGFVITGGTISENQAFGGGMLHTEGSPTITNCSFQGNSATYGGAVYLTSGSPRLTNCSFQGNSAAYGGAIANYSSAVLINCSFQGNTATSVGGAVYNANNSDARLINCSFQGNSAITRGGAVYNSNSTLTMSNCVLWNNGGTLAFYDATGGVSVSYCLLEAGVGGYTDGGNNHTATTSPFVSANAVALNACAPAINLGSNANYQAANGGMPPSPATDLAGNPRIHDGVIDIGAVEYQAAPTINIPPPSVNTATAGAPFSQSFVASGGSGPYSYTLYSGSLPTGLSLATTGVLSGIPTQGGSFTLTVRGQDATGCLGVSAPYILLVQLDSPIRYIRAGASGSGSSWADASGDLQSQINLVGAQQVWVATGTYKPGLPNNTNRGISFAMRPNVAIYGGFAGTETALSQRVLGNPLATILTGDIGTAGSNADNSYHVFNNPPGLTNSAVLDGFLITGGNANGSSLPNDAGGGMLNNGNGANNNCSPLIRNCLFQNNSTVNGGGAIYNAGYTNGSSNPSLINCAFQNNTAANGGGAIYNDGSVGGNSNPSLTNCSFQANSAASGRAMYNIGYQGSSRPVLTNCVVWGNGGASTFYNGPGAFITTRYSLFESSVTGYSPGTGNLTTATTPFANATTTRLSCGSAAINAGDPATTSATVGSIDLAGNPRFFNGGIIDMGAYEASDIATAPPSVNTATVGQFFSQSFTASGGSGPYSYSLVSGSLPTGFNLATTGVLSGTPTQTGSFTIIVKTTDANGCSAVSASYTLTVTPAPAPDVTLLIRAQPSIIYNTKPINVVTDVVEINSVNTVGKITLRIIKDNIMSLSFDPTATSVGGRAVSNTSWTFSQTSSYYELTTTSVITGGNALSVGLSGTLTPGITRGNLSLSATVVGGGETRFDNNNAATKIDYFPNL